MSAPIPQHKWSWKFDECIICGTTEKTGKHKHKGRGLCLSCWDKKRGRKPNRKVTRKKAYNKWYEKVKGTEKYKEDANIQAKHYRETSKAYRAYLKKNYIRLKFRRIILNRQNNKGRLLKRNEGGIQFRCNGCEKNCLLQSPIKAKGEIDMRSLKIFKEEQIKICKGIIKSY